MRCFKLAFLSFGVLLVSILSACAAKIDTAIAADNSAKIEVLTSFSPVLQAYLKDLSGEQGNFFDEKTIRKQLSEQKGMTVLRLEAGLEKGINIGAKITDIRQFLASGSAEVRSLIAITNDGSKKRLVLTLNRQIVSALLALGGPNKDISYLLPQDKSLTAQKYQEQLIWALEEYGEKAQMAEVFKGSRIKLQLNLPGPVQSLKGFTMIDQKAGKIALDLSLIEVLTLQETKQFEVVY